MTDETASVPETSPTNPPPLSCRMVGNMALLFAALAKASGEFAPIEKDRHVRIQSSKGAYDFDYATLESVLSATGPALAANGLKLFHFLCDAADGAREIHHMLTHESGAFLEAVQVIRMPDGGGWQQFGSAITYARRYQVQCMLGVSAEHDDDGNAADGNTVLDSRSREKRREPPAPKPAPQAPPKAQEPAGEAKPDPAAEIPEELSAAIAEAFKARGYRGLQVQQICKERYGKGAKELNLAECTDLRDWIEGQPS